MIWSPLTFTVYSSKGRGGGPSIFFPFKSKWPLWQAHQMWLISGRYCTMQARCVQAAANAFNSFVGVFTKIAGWLPKRKIWPLLGFSSAG
jgi:hypothetical protein